MRYTTIIDITEMPAVYRCTSARILYLHITLKAGYHDNDRDIVDCSIRTLAAAAGLTMSATRHALDVLSKAGLIDRQGLVWHVRKWIPEQPITSRPKTAKLQERIEAAARRKADQEQRERQLAIEAEQRKQLEAQGKTGFMVYYEGLLKKAQDGDQEAARLVKRHRATYEQHLKSITNKNGKQ